MRPFWILLSFVWLAACAEPEFGGSEQPDEVVPLAQPLEFELVGRAEPNHYDVQIKIPGQVRNGSVQRIADGRVAVLSDDLQRKRGSVIDPDLLAGGEYRYRLTADSGTYESTVRIPFDLEISGVQNVSDLTEGKQSLESFHRIFLRQSAVLESAGPAVAIKADEIVSDAGVIRTWNPSQAASPGIKGRESGDISISVRKISGRLEVRSAGEKGGAGVKGVTGLQGERGGSGANLHQYPGSFCTYDGDPVFAWRYRNLVSQEVWNRDHPGRGQQGLRGLIGYPGGPGETGGRAGNIEIIVSELEPATLSVSAAGGEGGDGGVGGDGGPGGSGGPGGTIVNNHACDRGSSQCCRDSPHGPVGPVGPPGPQGSSGSRGPSAQIKINGELQQSEVYP